MVEELSSYTPQDLADLDALMHELSATSFCNGKEEEFLPTDEDSPIPLTGESFVQSIEANAEILNTTDHVVTLMPRIKTLLSDVRVGKVIDDESLSLSDWLSNYIGADSKESLTIIDLSLLPSDVTSIVTAVIARMVFEAQQRYLKLNKQCLPSELSPTVLSQCNSFLLHRISNDRDQELVHRLLPDNMRGILREMPSLPSQYAVLLGWASELPVLVKMRTLPKSQRPQSEDPDYWDVWTGAKERRIDWGSIANEWQNKKNDEKDIEDLLLVAPANLPLKHQVRFRSNKEARP